MSKLLQEEKEQEKLADAKALAASKAGDATRQKSLSVILDEIEQQVDWATSAGEAFHVVDAFTPALITVARKALDYASVTRAMLPSSAKQFEQEIAAILTNAGSGQSVGRGGKTR